MALKTAGTRRAVRQRSAKWVEQLQLIFPLMVVLWMLSDGDCERQLGLPWKRFRIKMRARCLLPPSAAEVRRQMLCHRCWFVSLLLTLLVPCTVCVVALLVGGS